MTICSLIIQTRAENLDAVSLKLENMTGVEIHTRSDEGKLVVLIDHPKRSYCSEAMMAMASMDGVVNASLVYEYYEAEDQVSEILETQDNKNISLKEVVK